MFKNISVKKAKIISALIGILGGLACFRIFKDNFSNILYEGFFAILGSIFIYILIYCLVFDGQFKEDIDYIEKTLSRDDFTQVYPKGTAYDNRFEESYISYYAKIKSNYDVEISIYEGQVLISQQIFDAYAFRRFFTV